MEGRKKDGTPLGHLFIPGQDRQLKKTTKKQQRVCRKWGYNKGSKKRRRRKNGVEVGSHRDGRMDNNDDDINTDNGDAADDTR
jgi:hypothetical protein